MFDENFIEDLPDNSLLSGKIIYDSFQTFNDKISQKDRAAYYEEYIKAFAILQAYSEANNIGLSFPTLSGDINKNITIIINHFFNTRKILDQKFAIGTLGEYKKVFKRKFGKGFFYEFSDGDLKRIQLLLNELREIISSTKDLDDDHKSRLLKKLEKLQSELNKRVSDLDRFWGLLIDGSIVLKKIGENAKPIIDRIQEITNIIWRVQSRAEELPSNIPLELPGGEKKE